MKKIISLMLAVIMSVSIMPSIVTAEENNAVFELKSTVANATFGEKISWGI